MEQRLDKSKTHAGVWSVVGSDAEPHPGELTFHPLDGLKLRLYSKPDPNDPYGASIYAHGMGDMVSIRGVTNGGMLHLLLAGCFSTRLSSDVLEYHVNSAFVAGADGDVPPHSLLDGSAEVTSVAFGVANLDALLEWPRFEFKSDSGLPCQRLLPFPEETERRSNGPLGSVGATLSVCPGYSCGSDPEAGGRRGTRISAQLAVQLGFGAPKPISETSRLAAHALLLLNLLIGRYSPMQWLMFVVDGERYYQLAAPVTRLASREADGFGKCPVSKASLPPLLDAWLRFGEEQTSIVARLAALLWKRSKLVDDELGHAVQALEGLGRHFHDERYLPDEEFQSLRTQLLTCMEGQPDDLQRRAEGAFAHLNSPSLVTLLCRLLVDLPRAITAKIIGIDDPKECNERAVKRFAQRVSKARNSQSHGRQVDSGEEPLRLLVDRLKALIIVIMLRHAGMPDQLLLDEYAGDGRSWRWG